ncbi:MAG: hypothetical protein IKW18_02170 [Clostridia bacterium]|nr:hypothetical protein [Clostridia bacterium]
MVAGGQKYVVAVTGDANCDGKVDQKDADSWANNFVGVTNANDEAIFYAADVFADGQINGADLAKLIQKYARAATYESNIGQ